MPSTPQKATGGRRRRVSSLSNPASPESTNSGGSRPSSRRSSEQRDTVVRHPPRDRKLILERIDELVKEYKKDLKKDPISKTRFCREDYATLRKSELVDRLRELVEIVEHKFEENDVYYWLGVWKLKDNELKRREEKLIEEQGMFFRKDLNMEPGGESPRSQPEYIVPPYLRPFFAQVQELRDETFENYQSKAFTESLPWQYEMLGRVRQLQWKAKDCHDDDQELTWRVRCEQSLFDRFSTRAVCPICSGRLWQSYVEAKREDGSSRDSKLQDIREKRRACTGHYGFSGEQKPIDKSTKALIGFGSPCPYFYCGTEWKIEFDRDVCMVIGDRHSVPDVVCGLRRNETMDNYLFTKIDSNAHKKLEKKAQTVKAQTVRAQNVDKLLRSSPARGPAAWNLAGKNALSGNEWQSCEESSEEDDGNARGSRSTYKTPPSGATKDDRIMLFPFLVYEAKAAKTSLKWKDIQLQSSQTIKAFLDAQNRLYSSAKKLSRLRKAPSALVWFICSKGAKWRISMAFTPSDKNSTTSYEVVRIWKGNISEIDGALQALLLIDYVVDWARDIYRCDIVSQLRLLSLNASTAATEEEFAPRSWSGMALRHASFVKSRFHCIFISEKNLKAFQKWMGEEVDALYDLIVQLMQDAVIMDTKQILALEEFGKGERVELPSADNAIYYTVVLFTSFLSSDWRQIRELSVIAIQANVLQLIRKKLKVPHEPKNHHRSPGQEALKAVGRLKAGNPSQVLYDAICRRAVVLKVGTNSALYFDRADAHFRSLIQYFVWKFKKDPPQKRPLKHVFLSSEVSEQQHKFDLDLPRYGPDTALHASGEEGCVLIYSYANDPQAKSEGRVCAYLTKGVPTSMKKEMAGKIIQNAFETQDVYHTTQDNGFVHSELPEMESKSVRSVPWNIEHTYGIHTEGFELIDCIESLTEEISENQGSWRTGHASGRYLFGRNPNPWRDARVKHENRQLRAFWLYKLMTREISFWRSEAARKWKDGIHCCDYCAKEGSARICAHCQKWLEKDDDQCIKYKLRGDNYSGKEILIKEEKDMIFVPWKACSFDDWWKHFSTNYSRLDATYDDLGELQAQWRAFEKYLSCEDAGDSEYEEGEVGEGEEGYGDSDEEQVEQETEDEEVGVINNKKHRGKRSFSFRKDQRTDSYWEMIKRRSSAIRRKKGEQDDGDESVWVRIKGGRLRRRSTLGIDDSAENGGNDNQGQDSSDAGSSTDHADEDPAKDQGSDRIKAKLEKVKSWGKNKKASMGWRKKGGGNGVGADRQEPASTRKLKESATSGTWETGEIVGDKSFWHSVPIPDPDNSDEEGSIGELSENEGHLVPFYPR